MRLFVAVDVAQAARDALAASLSPLKQQHTALRWIPSANWHLTLAFLGDTPVGRRQRAQIALQAVARRARPCDLTIDGRLGRFADRVLWVAVASSAPGLPTLADAVQDALRGTGLTIDDRPFRAHLTLARARRGQRIPRVPPTLDGPALPVHWTVSTVALLSSQRDDGGSRYRPVATWPLGVRGHVSRHP